MIANHNIRGAQHYHLQVAPAGPDDTALAGLRTGARVRGVLHGDQIDMVDLYRFTITKRSVTYLRLAGGHKLFLQLVNQRALRVLREGGKYDSARADYAFFLFTLRRPAAPERDAILNLLKSRRERLAEGWLNPRDIATVIPTTTPASAGRYVVTFERYDPLAGWLFAREVHVTGTGTVRATYDPPGPAEVPRPRGLPWRPRRRWQPLPFTRFEVADRDDT